MIIVIALAKIGIDIINNNDVIIIDQQNNLRVFIFIKFIFINNIVIMKFIDLITEESPFKCSEKIIIFIVMLLFCVDRGGYSVQPVLMLLINIIFIDMIINDGNNIQNLRLFIRG